jgi:molybdate transport system regulatory protein
VPTFTFKIRFDPEGQIGHGKVELLEQIADFGSISAGARRMNMSYKRAWDLVEEMNTIFGKPVLATQKGGRSGGGAQLTPTGLAVVARYRAIERAVEAAAAPHIEALAAEIEGK